MKKRITCLITLLLVLLAALGCADEIRNLFTNVEYTSIEEVIRERAKD